MSEDAPPTAPTEPAGDAPLPGESVPSQALREASPDAAETAPPAPASSPYRTAPAGGPAEPAYRPNYVFLAIVSIISLVLDLGTKAWAKVRLDEAKSVADRHIDVLANHLAFTFAKNRGGAWGLFQDQPESIRRPFFLAISFLAIAFIVSLYRKLTPRQWALKWGLPLVLGGALGNLVNRIQYNYVVDFIDYRADWVRWLNGQLARLSSPDGVALHPSDHWPTFNVADVAIVAGVILMAVDMFTPAPKRAPSAKLESAATATPDVQKAAAEPDATHDDVKPEAFDDGGAALAEGSAPKPPLKAPAES
jgi:signal peptidase II